MPSKRTSRERTKSRMSRKAESESNEIEELSSQSYAGNSGEHSHKLHRIERLSSNTSRRERNPDEDTEDYFSDMKHKKTLSNRKKSKSESKDSIEEIMSDEVYSDRDEDTSKYKKNKNHRKPKKRSDNHYDNAGDGDSSVKKDNARSKRKKQHKQDDTELPIAEILKKAQEQQQQRTKYEEPAPLPELTTDRIYVQGRNGFSAMKIHGHHDKHSRRSSEATPADGSGGPQRPIKVAIAFQKVWRSSGYVFQGLLAGIAMMHFIYMETYFDNSEEFISVYSALSEIYTSVYSFLIFMCVIATFDKFDLAHIGVDHLRDIRKHHLLSILAVPLYIVAFSLHQATLKVEDKMTLINYNSSNVTYLAENSINDSGHVGIRPSELHGWRELTLSKDALAVIGWIFVSLGSGREDMLLAHLQAMCKYAEADARLPA